MAVELLQSFALHLQFHLRILLEDLRVSLTKHLGHPLVGYAAGTEPRGVGRAEVVKAKIRYLANAANFRESLLETNVITSCNLTGTQFREFLQ